MYKYRYTKVVCSGEIKGCDECSGLDLSKGFCSLCGRDLSSSIGEKCGSIIGYLERTKESEFKKTGKIHIKCTCCNTMNTI